MGEKNTFYTLLESANQGQLSVKKMVARVVKEVKLHDYDGDMSRRWFITYYEQLDGDDWQRKQIFVSQKINTASARRVEAERIKRDLTRVDDTRNNPPLAEAIVEAYIYKRDTLNGGGSLRSYRLAARWFVDYVVQHKTRLYLVDATEDFMADFVHTQFVRGRKVKPVSVNSYVRHLRALFSHLHYRYRHPNPLVAVHKLRENEPELKVWPEAYMAKLSQYLKEHDRGMYLAVVLVFHSFLRPVELHRLQLLDFDLKEGVVHVSADKGKSTRSKSPTLSQPAIELLAPLLKKYPAAYYLFGNKLEPGPEPHEAGYLAKQFKKVREGLGLPAWLKLYGFKHTGNSLHLSAGASISELMAQNGHQEERTTRRYARKLYVKSNKRFKDSFPEF